MIDPRVQSLCDEFGVRIIGKHRYPEPGETRAVATIGRIIDRYGIEHARLVMTTLRETANNHALLDEVGLWGTSDAIRAWSEVVEKRAGDWLSFWDRMEVGVMQFRAQKLRGMVPVRYAFVGMLHERLDKQFGDDEPDLFDGKEFA